MGAHSKEKDEVRQDAEGRYRRDLGWKYGNARMIQHRFRLGRDRQEAERRNKRLECLWECVQQRWNRLKGEGRTNDPVPVWDDVTLTLGTAIAQGLSVCEVSPPTGMESAEPATLLRWLAQLQTDFPVIPLRLPDAIHGAGVNAALLTYGERVADLNECEAAADAALQPLAVLYGNGAPSNGQTLHEALDAFCEHIGNTKLLPDGRPSPTAKLWQRQVKQIKEHCADMPLSRFGLVEVEGMVTHWQNRPVTRRGEPAAPDTVRDVVKRIRMFVKWLNKSPVFEWRKPADLEWERVRIQLTQAEKTALASPEQVDTYTLPELVTLYEYASPYERFFMLLACNCGFGQAEILTLEKAEIQGTHIKRARGKTGVWGEWNLWPETQAALAWMLSRHVPDKETSGIVVTKDGTPVPYLTKGSNRNMVIANAWKGLAKRIRKDKKAFRDLSFNKLRKTSGDMVKRIAGEEVASVFVAHLNDSRDALLRHYTNKDFDKLYAAVTTLRERLSPMFATVADPFPVDGKRSNPALSRGQLKRMQQMREQGFKIVKIAEELGCHRATVRYWLSRLKAGTAS